MAVTPAPQRRSHYAAFIIAGGIGFVVDAGGLALLQYLGLPALIGRIISIFVALFVTWRINRRITFGAAGQGDVREFARYLSVGASTSVLNYLVFALLVAAFEVPNMLALAIASLVAMVASYMGYDRLVFSRSKD